MLRSRHVSLARRRLLLRAAALPACLVTVAVAAAPAHAELTLGPPDTRTTFDRPEGVVLVDVDRDGFDDAVVGNREDQAIQLFRGGAGGFAAPAAVETGHNLPVAVAAGDLDGDGAIDLISSSSVGSDNSEVSVLLGDGAGGFAAAPGSPFATTADGPETAGALALADITGDGKLDVVTGGDQELVVLPGDGSGRLLAPVVDAMGFSSLRTVAVGDFVGDARPDVITGSGQPQQLSELFENVGGALEFHSLRDDTGNAVIAGDLDGAGRDDLVFTRLSGSDVGTLLSTGDGTFADDPLISNAGMIFVAGMALDDVDADGRADLAVGGDEAVELFAGSGPAGAFTSFPGLPIATTGMSFDVALGDVTGDGQPDLVHTTRETDTLTLVKNLNGASASGPAGVDFGTVVAGAAPVERTVTLTSGGPGFYRVDSAAVAGAGGGGIAIAADGCSGRRLAVGAGCDLTLRFSPAAIVAVAATLEIADNSAGGARSIPLTATVTAAPGGDGPSGPGPGPGGLGPGGSGPGGGSGGADRDTTAPALTGLRLAPATFAVAGGATAKVAARGGTRATGDAARGTRATKRGTTIRFALSEAARVTLAVERRASGRRSGRRCVAPTPALRRAKAKACVRFVSAGTLVRGAARRGANTIAFSGRIGRKALAPGRYRLTATAVDPAGNRSSVVRRAAFRVVQAAR